MFAQLQFAIDDAKLTFLTTTKKNKLKTRKNSSLICSSVFLKKPILVKNPQNLDQTTKSSSYGNEIGCLPHQYTMLQKSIFCSKIQIF